MPRERQNIIRIAANFARLIFGFVFGLLLVRVLLGLGQEVYGVIVVLAAGAGIAEMLREVIRASMVPKLGEAWHDPDSSRFEITFNSALFLSILSGLATLVAFGALTLLICLFDIPAELRSAAQIFLWLRGIQVVFTVAIGPIVNMYVVTERMVEFNVVMIVERAVELIAASFALYFFSQDEPAVALVNYGILATLTNIILQFGVVCRLLIPERRFRPRLSLATYSELKGVAGSFGWNAIQALALNLHQRLDIIIMNSWFGLSAGLIFSIAAQLASYVRRLTMGVVVGLDAMSARFQSRADAAGLRAIAGRQMFFQALLIFPAVVLVLFEADELLLLWVGTRLENPSELIPSMALISRILVVGIAARSLSESWMAIMAGAGKVRLYSPIVLAGAILNPLLIAAGVWIFSDSSEYLVPAISYCFIFVVVHLAIIPAIAARFLRISWRRMFQPVIGPLAAAAGALGLALLVSVPGYSRFGVSLESVVFLASYGIIMASFIFFHRKHSG